MFDDLNYPYSIQELYPGESGLMIRKARFNSIFRKIVAVLFYAVKQVNPFFKRACIFNGIETVVVISSLNQYRALEKLINGISNLLVISTFPVECKYNIIVNCRGNCWISLINAPYLIFNMLKREGFKYQAMIYYFDDYLNAPGIYNQAFKYLKAIKPKSLLVANDHSVFPRSYFRAAEKLDIKTIYTQHASVSSHFPPLEFTYAFLDGQESLDKYTANGREHLSNVFLSGSPRFDKIPLIPKTDTYDLGVATNILDNKEKVMSFVKMLLENKINFIMRPHPGQADVIFWKQYCSENKIGYSNPFEDNAITFIASSKCFVIGDSALHLEVALCKKISYYLNFQNNKASDCYDFIKEGLIDIKTEKQIIDILTEKTSKDISVKKIKYYVSNFETDYWGKSTSLIEKTIDEINSGSNLSQWEIRSGESKLFDIKGH